MNSGIIFTSRIGTEYSESNWKSHLLDEYVWESFGILLEKVLLNDYSSIYDKIVQEDIEFFHYHRINELNSKELKLLVDEIDNFFKTDRCLSKDLLIALKVWDDLVRPDLISDSRYYSDS